MIFGDQREEDQRAIQTPTGALPRVATWQLRLFARYCGYYLRLISTGCTYRSWPRSKNWAMRHCLFA